MVEEPPYRTPQDDTTTPAVLESGVPSAILASEPKGPLQVPLRGWWNAGWRVADRVAEDNLALVAAGVAFYGLLALFPALGTAVSVYGLVSDRGDVARAAEVLRGLVPDDVRDLILAQLAAITSGDQASLSAGAVMAFAISVWSANKGTKSIFTGLNVAYREREERGFIVLNVFSLAATLVTVFAMAAAVGLVAMLPVVQGPGGYAVQIIRWAVLTLGMFGFITALYRFGPSRSHARWRWLSLGAVAATVLWLIGSAGFSFYVEAFGSYNETFGALGGVVILLTWIWLSAFVVLLGAELNAELEYETLRDSTVGVAKPLGERGAYVADHVPESTIERVQKHTRGETNA